MLFQNYVCLEVENGGSDARETIRTRIIPHAVKWYTGEANEDDDDEDDDEDDDVDEDDDEVSTNLR